MSEPQDQTVFERIQSKFNQLTRAERQLANAMLENYPVSGLGGVAALAEAADVSPPTVARMARKLGFGGFPELQAQLRSELDATISDPISKHDRWAANAPDTHILNLFADAVSENLRQTLKRLNSDSFNEVVELLSAPDRSIFVVGGRITRSLAEYLFTHLQMIRGGVTLVSPNSNAWPHYLLNMRERDVLVIFDIRRYERDLLRLAEMAEARGVAIVLVSDQWGSPVAKFAKHSLQARIEAPSAWDSSIVILFIIEAIIASAQTSTWGEARTRMDALETLFDEMKMFRKFT